MTRKCVPVGQSTPYGPDSFQREFAISDEILGRLEIYADLLQKWQHRINLVGRSTIPDLWARHMRDSAQLGDYMGPSDGLWLDIGSGAGFPGLVLAILGYSREGMPVHLVESDHRKGIFLQEVIRATNAAAQVHTVRAESLDSGTFGGPAAQITARAVAPLHQLLDLTAPLTGPLTNFLLLKGQDVDGELTLAAKYRKMSVTQHPSRTNPAGVVLRITEVARV